MRVPFYRVWDMLEDSFAKSKDYQPTAREWLTSAWNGNLITYPHTNNSGLTCYG